MNHFPVGGIKERHAKAVPVAGSVEGAARVTLGLLKDVLRADGDFLCFDDAQELALNKEGVIGGAVRGREFRDCMMVQRGNIEPIMVRGDIPTGRYCPELFVDPLFPGLPLKLCHDTTLLSAP